MTEYKKAFIDTAPFIYYIEGNLGNLKYAGNVKTFLMNSYNNGVHLVSSACLSGCDVFLTNDEQLRQFTEIKCITVDEIEFL